MADYTTSKPGFGGMMPENAIETSWDNAEPLITPEKLLTLHLFGIPMVSAIRNPLTGKPDRYTPEILKEYIVEAVALAEAEIGSFSIFPRQHTERHPYDQPLQNSFGYSVVRNRPVASIEKLAVASSDGINVWDVPLAWIDTGYLHQGQINLIPFAIAGLSGVTIPVTSPVSMGLLPSLFKFPWVPALWNITYTTGFKDGAIPRVLNQLIGVIAAMEILSQLATTYARSQSSSLGIDGLSQSQSTPGPELFNTRLEMLGDKRKWLISKIKRSFGLGFFVDNV